MSEEEKKKIDVKFVDGKVVFSIDPNKDGEPLAEGSLILDEAVGEAFRKGTKVDEAKTVDVEFSLSSLVVRVDTDRDGETLLELKINLGEALDEFIDRDDEESEAGEEPAE